MLYPSDLTDEQWELIKQHFDYGNYGKGRKHEIKTLISAVFYLTKAGCQWRQLPNDFPPYSTTHSFYRRAREKGIWDKMTQSLVQQSREKMGKDPDPTYSLIDSQSVKTTSAAKKRGIDGGKKVKGRKRHIVTDTNGHLLYVQVHEANLHDTVAGCDVFKKAVEKYPSITGVCADAGYRKTMENFVTDVLQKTIEISARISKEWVVLAKRWVVERTFSWLNHFRRLSKDFEISVASEENYIMIAHSITLLKRLSKL